MIQLFTLVSYGIYIPPINHDYTTGGLRYTTATGVTKNFVATSYHFLYGSQAAAHAGWGNVPVVTGTMQPFLYEDGGVIQPADYKYASSTCPIKTSPAYNNSIVWGFAWNWYLTNCGVGGFVKMQKSLEPQGVQAIYFLNWANMMSHTMSRHYNNKDVNDWQIPLYIGTRYENVFAFFGDWLTAGAYNTSLSGEITNQGSAYCHWINTATWSLVIYSFIITAIAISLMVWEYLC
jgi:hypothetical protein